MKLIVGLGNPGKEHVNNRHNLGYMVVEKFAQEEGLSWQSNLDWICYFAKTGTYLVIKPTTFMNKSGEAIVKVAAFFKIKAEDVIIVYDELDLPFAKIRLAFNGLSAGHKGIESAIVSLGTIDFGRLRVGVGRPDNPKQDVSDFLLSDFNKEEAKKLPNLIESGAIALRAYLADGLSATMNRFN